MIDPRYARFVVSIEPPLTEQAKRDIVNSGKKPKLASIDFATVKRSLTRSEKLIVQARARIRKAQRRARDA